MTSTQKKTDALLDELLKGCRTPEDILGQQGLLKQLTKRMVERALEAEMRDHLGYEPHAPEGRGTGNSRNGKTKKTVQSDAGQFEIEVPRDREGSFEPQLVRKRQRRLDGFDDKVLALYARGLSTRDIKAQLEELYGRCFADADLKRDRCGSRRGPGLAKPATGGGLSDPVFRRFVREIARGWSGEEQGGVPGAGDQFGG